jgi:hypothetical protein
VEGQLLTGKDKLIALQEGPLFGPVSNSASIMAGGGAFTLESRNQHLYVNVLGGNMSEFGKKEQGITGSITGRNGVEGGFFVEGNLTQQKWYASTGDFSYAGLGYVLNQAGARIMVGAGLGIVTSAHIPFRGFEIDLVSRAASPSSRMEVPSSTLSIGLKRAFTLR